jgi:RNA-directed DNA polymerase
MSEQMVLERVLERGNLKEAWSKVKANAGGAGIDQRTIAQTHSHLKAHWPGIAQKLMAGSYRPGAIRPAAIQKKDGGTRVLGIPNVQDRLIQQAMLQVLSPMFDPEMSAHSYGYRPGRSAQDAIASARGYVLAGKTWVVDLDLKNFFDQIDHDKLMHQVSRRVRDKRVLKLLGAYLRAPLQTATGEHQRRLRGTPQGGPLSPLLANIYLDPLDKELTSRGLDFVRYADDIAIFVGSERAAERVLAQMIEWLAKHLKLEVNRDKSGTGKSDQSKLLSTRIHCDGQISVADHAIEELKATVRELWNAQQSRRLTEVKQNWQRFIAGWWNYFKIATDRTSVTQLSGWIRRHMRKYMWQRWHNHQGRRNALYHCGIRGRSLAMASCSRGAWVMARHPVTHQALSNAALASRGYLIPWTLAP